MSNQVLVETSARHVHVTQQDLETLREIMARAEALCSTPGEKGKAFREIAESVLSE